MLARLSVNVLWPVSHPFSCFSSLYSRLQKHSGGDPTASAQSAGVILADPNTEVFNHLVKMYQGVQDKYVESYLWVKKCVEKGAIVYTPLVYKNPGGRRPGEEYVPSSTSPHEPLTCAGRIQENSVL